MALSKAEAGRALAPRDDATNDFVMQQTMFRIKDPKVTLDFYSRILGMRLLKRLDVERAKITLYFMGYEDERDIPEDETERTQWALSRRGVLELTHHWGTENDPKQHYHTGNTEPTGFGHIGILVPDTYAACDRLEKLGVKFWKKPDDDSKFPVKGLAFIEDPDGYWIEIFNNKLVPT